MRTLKAMILAPVIAVAAVVGAEAASDWETVITCSASTPTEDQKLTLYYVYDRAADKAVTQIRVATKDVILDRKEKGVKASLEIEGQDTFTMQARGAGNEKSPLVILAVPPDSKVLAAISRGHKAVVKLAAAAGEKVLAFDLAGSGAAVKHISRCRP